MMVYYSIYKFQYYEHVLLYVLFSWIVKSSSLFHLVDVFLPKCDVSRHEHFSRVFLKLYLQFKNLFLRTFLCSIFFDCYYVLLFDGEIILHVFLEHHCKYYISTYQILLDEHILDIHVIYFV